MLAEQRRRSNRRLSARCPLDKAWKGVAGRGPAPLDELSVGSSAYSALTFERHKRPATEPAPPLTRRPSVASTSWCHCRPCSERWSRAGPGSCAGGTDPQAGKRAGDRPPAANLDKVLPPLLQPMQRALRGCGRRTTQNRSGRTAGDDRDRRLTAQLLR